MNVNNLEFIDYYFDSESEFSMQTNGNDDLINATNKIREQYGMEDLDDKWETNEVYYNFYVIVNTNNRKITLTATVYNSEKDEGAVYVLSLTERVKEDLIWCIMHNINTLTEKDII